MVPFLLACLRSNLSGGGGGGAFVITSVNVTVNQPGTTACSNPLKFNVSLEYTGSVSGITLLLEKRWDEGAWETVDTGLLPTGLPSVVSAGGMYNKFGTSVPMQFRITDETDPLNTATSAAYTTNYTLCV